MFSDILFCFYQNGMSSDNVKVFLNNKTFRVSGGYVRAHLNGLHKNRKRNRRVRTYVIFRQQPNALSRTRTAVNYFPNVFLMTRCRAA